MQPVPILQMDIDFFLAENEKKKTTPPMERISDYIEARRIMPSWSPFPGYYDFDRTPYVKEILDCLAPSSLIQHVVFMKPVQIGATSGVQENTVAYYIGECPAEILYISGTDKLLEKWATRRLDPMIDSCYLRGLISAQTGNPKTRRTGDKVYVKEFIGGSLDMVSAQSPASLRQEAKRIILRDEIDSAPANLRTGEGNWLEVSEARGLAFGDRRKICDTSTPTTFDESQIYQLFLDGDQRRYFIPCPLCGKYQPLDWTNEQSQYGLKPETKAGELQNVYYVCDFCHDAFFNHHKSKFLGKGEWRPTATSKDPTYRSYGNFSSLYSPIGMFTWRKMWKKWVDAQEDPDKMRAFVNLHLGMPFQEKGARPTLDKVIELRGGYREKEVQDGVLFLTAGVDVQRGSLKDENNPPRLEMEILGHGLGYRTWSLVYKVFYGDVMEVDAGAWAGLNEFALETGLVFKRSDGRKFGVQIILIDSGDGQVTDLVYQFCRGWQNTYPCKGFGRITMNKKERNKKELLKGDEETQFNFRRYRAVKLGEEDTLIEISTNFYKTRLYNALKVERQDTGLQRPNFCDFPARYGEKYFRMLTAEEKRRDGSFYCPSGRRNEALDVRVYNLCAADYYLNFQVNALRGRIQHEGAKPEQVQKVNHRMILDHMARETARETARGTGRKVEK